MNNFLIKDNDGEFKVLDKQSGDVSVIPQAVERSGNKKVVAPQQRIVLTSPEDEEDKKEISQHENLTHKQLNHTMNAYILDLVRGIIQDLNFSFNDNAQKERFQKMLFTVLRGARKISHIKEWLLEDKTIFKVEITQLEINNLENAVKEAQDLIQKKFKLLRQVMNESVNKKQEIQQHGREIKKKEGLDKLRKNYLAQDYSVNSLLQKNKADSQQHVSEHKELENIEVNKQEKSVNQEGGKHGDAQNKEEQRVETRFTKQPKKETQRIDPQRIPQQGRQKISLEKQTVKIKPPANPLLVKQKSSKPSMVDVVAPEQARTGYDPGTIEQERQDTVDTRAPRLSGPLDELRHMTLVDFRRLSDNMSQRLDKLEEKINLLEERSYIDRIKGVLAWQASPLYKMYIELGYHALAKNIPLETVINSYRDANKETLTAEEFLQLGELNHKLSF